MEKICQTCAHFRQHYTKVGQYYRKTRSGHCVYPRKKLRYCEKAACEHYKEKV